MQTQLNFPQVAEIKVIYSSNVKPSERPEVKSSRDAYDLAIQFWPDQVEYREAFVIMHLNRSNKVLGYSTVSLGGLTGTVVDPRMIFQAALKANSNSIILMHNHPSGNLQPSDADIRLTDRLKKAGEILEIQVLDHLIVTTESYYSFADSGSL